MTFPTSSSPAPVAVITGAARGIGMASAEWFLAADYRVVLIDSDAPALAATAQRLGDATRVLAITCDVSSPPEVAAAVEKDRKSVV